MKRTEGEYENGIIKETVFQINYLMRMETELFFAERAYHNTDWKV